MLQTGERKPISAHPSFAIQFIVPNFVVIGSHFVEKTPKTASLGPRAI